MRHHKLLYKLTALFGALLLGLAWALTPAGTAIQNQASATYLDSAGLSQTTNSNLVVTIVQQVYGLSITPNGADENNPGQTVYGLPGSSAQFNYTVTNTGNGNDTFNLSLAQGTSDNFDLLSPAIYQDSNCNGTLDAGENTPISSIDLAGGASACLLVVGTVPTSAASGEYANLNLSGASAGDATVTDSDNWARAVATTSANLTAFKSASPSSAAPGDTVTYTIHGSNTGGSAAGAVTSVVTVDGTSKDGILITDMLPGGLGYVAGSLSGSAGAGTVTLIYSTDGGSTWTATEPASGVNAVGMLIEGSGAFFPQSAGYTLSFQAQVPASAAVGTSYDNFATVQFDANGDGDAADPGETVSTNTTTVTVGASYGAAVGPYTYPQGGASGSYTAAGYTVSASGDTQTIATAYNGDTVIFRHTLKNTGNASDSYNLSFSGAPAGWTCVLLADDLSTPISGSVGPIAAGATYDFALKCQIPTTYTSTSAVNLTVTATSTSDSTASDTTTDTLNAVDDGIRLDLYGGVTSPYEDSKRPSPTSTDNTSDDSDGVRDDLTGASANPGDAVTYRLRVENINPNGESDTYALTVTGGAGYTDRVDSVTFYADADNDGVPDGGPITNTGPVSAGNVFHYLAVVQLKANAPAGAAGFTFLATSALNGETDEAYTYIDVNLVAQIQLEPHRSGTVTSPGTIQYTHTLTNLSNADASNCSVTGTGGSHGFTYQYSLDGSTWSSSLSGISLPSGSSQTVYVRVNVPAGVAVGTSDTNTLTASCDVGSTPTTVSDSATETTTIVGGELQLQKSAVTYVGSTTTVRSPDGSQAYPGDEIEYTITASNIGTGDLQAVKVSDPLPGYTDFVSVSASASGFSGTVTVLYSTDGSTWSSTAPTSLSPGSSIYVGVDTNGDGTIDNNDTMPSGATLTVTFRVQVQ